MEASIDFSSSYGPGLNRSKETGSK